MLLENIELSKLPSVYLLEKNKLPVCAAIYFISNTTGEILYIGRTRNLLERWREHHRFPQLKRMNRRERIKISWLSCTNDLTVLSNLENHLIQLHKPPLNWTKVTSPARRITPLEVSLQQSLRQLANSNVMILGFNPVSDREAPTIHLVYPVYGKRGLSGTIRSILRNSNKKASSLKWKEYQTERKSWGGFGYWETEYQGIRIDLSPFDRLVCFMDDCTTAVLGGIKFMSFSSEQLEFFLENVSEEIKKELSGLEVLVKDPTGIQEIDKSQSDLGKDITTSEVIPWDELEPMAEGEARIMTRQFLDIDGVEVEVCPNSNGKYFVRHNVYWWIVYGDKNPDPEHDCVVENLQMAIERLPTIRWCGYKFRLESIIFSEDDVEVESILLPLPMFEDLVKAVKSNVKSEIREQIESGEYQVMPQDSASLKLCAWLHRNSLTSLLQKQTDELSSEADAMA